MGELFPIMALSYRPDKEICELRSAGVAEIIIGLPWAMIAPHEAQAQRNHGQTLKRLAERGGLAVCEALAVLEDRRWERMPKAKAMGELALRLAEFTARQEPSA